METETIAKWLLKFAPETAEQVLAWGWTINMLGLVAFGAIAGLALYVAMWCFGRAKKADKYVRVDWYVGLAVSGSVTTLLLVQVGINIYWLLMIQCYPRLYLLSYLQGFTK